MVHARLVRTAALAAAFAGLAPVHARACSVCGCGDPLLDASDPAATTSRLRLQLDTEYLDVKAGSETDATRTDRLKQYTLKLQAVYSPVDRLSVVAELPFTRKDLSTEGVTASDVSGVGDAEISARYALLDAIDLGARRRHTFAVSVGTSLPTGASHATMPDGELVDEHGQIGTGSWGPFAGLHYRFEQGDWFASASLSGRIHSSNDRQYEYGRALLWSVHTQYRPLHRLALDLGVDGRHAAMDRVHGDALELVENTGGTVLAIAPGAYWNVSGPVWLSVRAQIPFFKDLVGNQDVNPTIIAGLQYAIF